MSIGVLVTIGFFVSFVNVAFAFWWFMILWITLDAE